MKSLQQQMDDLPKDDERWTAKLKVMEENMGRRFEEAKESLRP